MEVFSQINSFTNAQLEATLSSGDLDPQLLEVIKNQRLAGRHLAKIKKDVEYRSQLGFTMADFLDIEEALDKGLSSSSKDKENEHPADDFGDMEENADQSTEAPPVEKMLSNLGESGPADKADSDSSDFNISLESSCDEDLLEFLPKETIKEMDAYHLHIAKTQIEKFKFCLAKGIPCKRPQFLFNKSPSPPRRKRSGGTIFQQACNPRDVLHEQPQTSKGSQAFSSGGALNQRSATSKVSQAFTSRGVLNEQPSTSKDSPASSSRGALNEQPSTSKDSPASSSRDALNEQPATSKGCGMKASSSQASNSKGSGAPKILSSRNKSKEPVPKKDIEEEHQAFLSSKNLEDPHKILIQNFLQSHANYTYSIYGILKDQEDLEDEWMLLQRDGILFGKPLDKVLRFLVEHLYTLVPNPNLVSPEMRESLAVCLVASFPKLGLKSRVEDTPWSWIYNRDSNTGKIANIIQGKQRTQKLKRLRGGGTEKRKKNAKEQLVPDIVLLEQVPDSALSKDAKFLKLLAANDTNKNEIIEKLKSTFNERRRLILESKYTVNAVLQVFHHLRSFRGEMAELEFRAIHPGKENEFLLNFSDVALKLVAMAEKESNKYSDCLLFQDVSLNAMLVLRKFLPKPVKCYKWENASDCVGPISDLIEVLPAGSNLQNSIETRRQHSKTTIQPYLLAVGSYDKLDSFTIVLGDSQYLMLPRNTQPIRALDLLFKIHFVLNVHYCLGWKNVYRFIAAHLYHLPPENKRLSVFTEKWLHLASISV